MNYDSFVHLTPLHHIVGDKYASAMSNLSRKVIDFTFFHRKFLSVS